MSIIFPNVSKIKTNLGSLNLPETLSYYFVNKKLFFMKVIVTWFVYLNHFTFFFLKNR